MSDAFRRAMDQIHGGSQAVVMEAPELSEADPRRSTVLCTSTLFGQLSENSNNLQRVVRDVASNPRAVIPLGDGAVVVHESHLAALTQFRAWHRDLTSRASKTAKPVEFRASDGTPMTMMMAAVLAAERLALQSVLDSRAGEAARPTVNVFMPQNTERTFEYDDADKITRVVETSEPVVFSNEEPD